LPVLRNSGSGAVHADEFGGGVSERTAFPLSWPDGWKRTQASSRTRAQFNKSERIQAQGPAAYTAKQPLSVADAVRRLLAELRRMGVPDWNIIISTNVPLRLDGLPRSDKEPADPGAAVYWKKSDKQPMRCMAIDRYTRVADNLAAIAATLEAMRAIERHGGGTILERAFLGFAALPERATQHWRETLGVTLSQPTMQHIEERFRALSQVHHPDKGGDRNKFEEIVQARDAARLELSERTA
jgi:hypothetical protein